MRLCTVDISINSYGCVNYILTICHQQVIINDDICSLMHEICSMWQEELAQWRNCILKPNFNWDINVGKGVWWIFYWLAKTACVYIFQTFLIHADGLTACVGTAKLFGPYSSNNMSKCLCSRLWNEMNVDIKHWLKVLMGMLRLSISGFFFCSGHASQKATALRPF